MAAGKRVTIFKYERKTRVRPLAMKKQFGKSTNNNAAYQNRDKENHFLFFPQKSQNYNRDDGQTGNNLPIAEISEKNKRFSEPFAPKNHNRIHNC